MLVILYGVMNIIHFMNRLKRNRTDLEVDGEARVWVCSAKFCYAIFKVCPRVHSVQAEEIKMKNEI